MTNSPGKGDTPERKLLRVHEAAQRLNVSIRTIWRMIAAKELHAVRIRGCTRVVPTQVMHLTSGTEPMGGL
jgi:excisionase family DNA binding protein